MSTEELRDLFTVRVRVRVGAGVRVRVRVRVRVTAHDLDEVAPRVALLELAAPDDALEELT